MRKELSVEQKWTLYHLLEDYRKENLEATDSNGTEEIHMMINKLIANHIRTIESVMEVLKIELSLD